MKKRYLISILVAGLLLSGACVSPSTTPPSETSSIPPLTTASKPEKSEMTPEELRKLVAEGKIKVVVSPVYDTKYWNTDWDIDKLSQTLRSINRQYYKTHAYIEGEFDCNDMVVELWNVYYEKGISSVIVVGNLDLENESFAQSDHAWLLVTIFGARVFAVEPTNSEVYTIIYDIDSDDEQFKQYLEGYYFALPSDLRAAIGDRW